MGNKDIMGVSVIICEEDDLFGPVRLYSGFASQRLTRPSMLSPGMFLAKAGHFLAIYPHTAPGRLWPMTMTG